MARGPNEKVKEAYALYKKGIKLVEIASQLNLPPGTIRRWKSIYEWNTERSDKNSERSHKNKGGQPGNTNTVGHASSSPPENKNAEKHGFFSKWLPEETMQIMQSIEKSNPIDLLWDNIQLQYTAIIRAQRIMYVKDQQDSTTTKIAEGYSDTGSSEKWEVQQAWDKQASFLNAQSRAMKTLESMLRQYDELCKSDLATDEQKARIALIKKRADIGKATDTSLMQALLDVMAGGKE